MKAYLFYYDSGIYAGEIYCEEHDIGNGAGITKLALPRKAWTDIRLRQNIWRMEVGTE